MFSSDYRKRIQAKQLISTDTFTELFPRLSSPKPVNGLKWTSGMKLEAIDPLNLASICVATVMKVRPEQRKVESLVTRDDPEKI